MQLASSFSFIHCGFDPRPPHYRSVWVAAHVFSNTEYWDGWPSLGGHTISVYNQPPVPTQPPTLCGTGIEYRLNCDDALQMGSKGRMVYSIWG